MDAVEDGRIEVELDATASEDRAHVYVLDCPVREPQTKPAVLERLDVGDVDEVGHGSGSIR